MKVSKGRKKKPFRVLLYGPGGVGKSTLAAASPNPVFIDPTNGTAELDVQRLEPDTWNWEVLSKAVQHASESEYSTIVIDELGAFEQLAWQEVLKGTSKKGIAELPYGQGYSASLDLFRNLTVVLERAGKNVILIGHSTIKQFNNPEGNDYHRYILSLHEKVAGLLYQWVDAYLLCRYEDFTGETTEQKTIGVSTGERKIYTVHKAAYDCKNRYNLPEELSMSDSDLLYRLITEGQNPDELIKLMKELRSQMVEDDAKKLDEYMSKAKKDFGKLVKVLNWAKSRKAK